MEVRKIEESDMKEVQAMLLNTIRHTYCDFINPIEEYLSQSGPLKHVVSNFECCYLFRENNRCKGLAIIRDNQILMIVVNIDFHRQGIGKYILQWCEDRLFEHYSEIFLDSVLENIRAMTFYIKQGWQLYDIKRIEDYQLHVTYFRKTKVIA